MPNKSYILFKFCWQIHLEGVCNFKLDRQERTYGEVIVRLHYNLLPRMIYYVRNCDIFWLLDCLHNFASTLQPLSFLVQGTLCGLFVLHHHWRITLMRRRILIGFLWVNISQRSKIQPEKFRNLESCFRINRTQLGQDRLRPRSFFSHIICRLQ